MRGRGGESKRERLIHKFTKCLGELEAFEMRRTTHVEQKMDEAAAGLSGSFNQMHNILEQFFTDNEKIYIVIVIVIAIVILSCQR